MGGVVGWGELYFKSPCTPWYHYAVQINQTTDSCSLYSLNYELWVFVLTFWSRAFSESSAWSSSSLVVATPTVVVRTGALSTLSTRSSLERNTCTSRHFRNSCTSSALFMTKVLDQDNIGGPSPGSPTAPYPRGSIAADTVTTPSLHRHILIFLNLFRFMNWLIYPSVTIF